MNDLAPQPAIMVEKSALLHAGVCYRLYRTSEDGIPLVLRIPTAAREILNEHQDIEKIAWRYNQFAATGHCVKAPFTWSAAEVPPYGALATEYITGRQALWTEDFAAAAECFSCLHRSEMEEKPYAFNMRQTIEQRMMHLESAPIEKASKKIINDIKDRIPDTPSATRTPIMVDAHPGNFIVIKEHGKKKMIAVDVDHYYVGDPLWDLAHFSLFSSMLWYDAQATPLDSADIMRFYARYFELSSPALSSTSIDAQRLTATRWQVLCRTLGWMLRLLSLAEAQLISPSSQALSSAHRILHQNTLETILKQEEELKTRWRSL